MNTETILIIGDTHIPDRVTELPRQLKSFIESTQFNFLLSTGDLTSQEVLSWMRKIAPLKAVKGNMDYLPLPMEETLILPSIKIGLIHGTGIWPRGDTKQLLNVAKRLDASILVSGHTHRPEVTLTEGILLLNPGSLTGAWGGSSDWSTPSFMTLGISEKEVKVGLFTLEERLKIKEKLFGIREGEIVL